MKILNWKWWNEKVIEVPEHFHDWYAPRWYLIICFLAHSFIFGSFFYAIYTLFISPNIN